MTTVTIQGLPELPDDMRYAGEYRIPTAFEWVLVNNKPVLVVPSSRRGFADSYGLCIIITGGDSEKLQWLKNAKREHIESSKRQGKMPTVWLTEVIAAIETLESQPITEGASRDS